MSDENELTPEDAIEPADGARASEGTTGATAEGAVARSMRVHRQARQPRTEGAIARNMRMHREARELPDRPTAHGPGASGTALVRGLAIHTTSSPEEMRAAQIATFKKVSPFIAVIAAVVIIGLAVHRSSEPPAFDPTNQSTWTCAGVDAATTDPAYSDAQVNVYDFTTWYAANCY